MGIDAGPTKTYPVVTRVAPDSPAERAGIRQGDTLVWANDRALRDINYWYWVLTNVTIGQPIVLETERDGQHLRAVLVLNRPPPEYW